MRWKRVDIASMSESWLTYLLDLELSFDPEDLRIQGAHARDPGALGLDVESLVGRGVEELWPQDCREMQRDRVLRGSSEDQHGFFDLRFEDSAGELYETQALVARGDDGAMRLGVRDLTREREREREIEERATAMEFTNQFITDLNRELERSGQQLEAARERLAALNDSKSRFLAVAAHELRTPMTAAKTAVSLLQTGSMGPITEQQGEVLAIIHQNVDRLVRLVNDLLDLARIEAGKVELAVQDFGGRQILSQTAELMQAEAARRGISISVECPETQVSADRDRIQQVLLNLLGNAIKFTPEGRRVILAGRPDDHGMTFEVRDSGEGIPEEQLPLLFQPFERLDTEATRKAKGTGLGLSISKELVDLHGGRIWAESRLGSGTSIFFFLPIRKTAQAAA